MYRSLEFGRLVAVSVIPSIKEEMFSVSVGWNIIEEVAGRGLLSLLVISTAVKASITMTAGALVMVSLEGTIMMSLKGVAPASGEESWCRSEAVIEERLIWYLAIAHELYDCDVALSLVTEADFKQSDEMTVVVSEEKRFRRVYMGAMGPNCPDGHREGSPIFGEALWQGLLSNRRYRP
ncbi:hypothetical protein ACLOJK_016298 [Asimina triloba]